MTDKKRRRLAIVLLGLSILVVGLWGYRHMRHTIPEHEPGQAQLQEHSFEEIDRNMPTPAQWSVSSAQLSDLISQSMYSVLPVSKLTAAIGDDCTISLSGVIAKSDLQNYLSNFDDAITGAYGSVLALMPDTIPISLHVHAFIDDHAVHLEGKKLSVASLDIPESFLDEDFFDSAEGLINQTIGEHMDEIDTLTAQDGSLLIDGLSV